MLVVLQTTTATRTHDPSDHNVLTTTATRTHTDTNDQTDTWLQRTQLTTRPHHGDSNHNENVTTPTTNLGQAGNRPKSALYVRSESATEATRGRESSTGCDVSCNTRPVRLNSTQQTCKKDFLEKVYIEWSFWCRCTSCFLAHRFWTGDSG